MISGLFFFFSQIMRNHLAVGISRGMGNGCLWFDLCDVKAQTLDGRGAEGAESATVKASCLKHGMMKIYKIDFKFLFSYRHLVAL